MTIEQQGTATTAAAPATNVEQILSQVGSQWLKLDSRLRGALALIEKHAEDSVDLLAAQLLVEEALLEAERINGTVEAAQMARSRELRSAGSSRLPADLPACH